MPRRAHIGLPDLPAVAHRLSLAETSRGEGTNSGRGERPSGEASTLLLPYQRKQHAVLTVEPTLIHTGDSRGGAPP